MTVARGASKRIRRLTGYEISCYDVLPREVAQRVILVRLPRLPGPFAGMALGRVVFLGRDIPPDGSSALLAHELTHVRQWTEIGAVGFTAAYLAHFGRSLARTRSWHQAYRAIGAECDAREAADRWLGRHSAAGTESRPPTGHT
ncbi:MAG: hypothetical protein ACFCVK_12380 [Acidimicrobiales bacterium]